MFWSRGDEFTTLRKRLGSFTKRNEYVVSLEGIGAVAQLAGTKGDMRTSNTGSHDNSNYIKFVVLQVQGYDQGHGVSENNFYPGVIKGRVMGGLLDGKTISVSIRKTLSNRNVLKVADLINKGKFSYTPIGGYLSLEGVRLDQGKITTQWLNCMGGPNAIIRCELPIQIAPSFGQDGQQRYFQVNGATIYNAQILHMADGGTAHTPDEFRPILHDALQARGAALIVKVLAQDVIRKTELVTVGWHQGKRMPVEKSVQDFLDRKGPEKLPEYFAGEAKVDVVPMEIVRLGSRVCKSIDAGAKHSVPINQYMTGGLGKQVEKVLKRSGKEFSGRLENTFLSHLHPRAKEGFASMGWQGVWNSDVIGFFATKGIYLPFVPKFGFAISTACLQPYGGDLYLTKARPFSDPIPRHAVPTMSDPHASTRFESSILNAVQQLSDQLEQRPPTGHQIKDFEESAVAKNESSLNDENGIKNQFHLGDHGPRSTLSAGEADWFELGDRKRMYF